MRNDEGSSRAADEWIRCPMQFTLRVQNTLGGTPERQVNASAESPEYVALGNARPT